MSTTRIDDTDFYPDNALPIHHRDDGPNGENRGLCHYSGTDRDSLGGCPLGCSGATEHYSNDGHRDCADEPRQLTLDTTQDVAPTWDNDHTSTPPRTDS